MPKMRIDVTIATYNSEKYLDDCLRNVRRAIPIRRLIVIDHYSSDRTVEIAERYGAEVYFENVSLGYARQMQIELVKTPFFMFIDSDVVLHDTSWFARAVKKLERNVGAIVGTARVKYSGPGAKHMQYWAESSWNRLREPKRFDLSLTLIRQEAIEGIKIPAILDCMEMDYVELYMRKKGFTFEKVYSNAVHYHSITRREYWRGAGIRLLKGLHPFPALLLGSFDLFKGVPAAFATNDPLLLIENVRRRFQRIKGFLQPMKYRKLKR